MARIVVGNRDGSLAIRKGRLVLERLVEEWPDLHLTLRTVSCGAGTDVSPLLDAVGANKIDVAVVQAEHLPLDLPEGLTLATVQRRADARSALVARGAKSFLELSAGATVGVLTERDAAFVRAANPSLLTQVGTDQPEAEMASLAAGHYQALVIPLAALAELDLRDRGEVPLETEDFTPAPGQGAVAFVVRDGDNLAFDTVYPLQHRPSLDRLRAERAFARALAASQPPVLSGALAQVSSEGELTLFGTVTKGEAVVQASTSGEARDAEEIGRELAQDVLERLARL